MDLNEALVEQGIATQAEVAEAEARSRLYGGDLITNLLDTRRVDEKAAQAALAAAFGLPLAPCGELPYASGVAIELVPREAAMRLGVYPSRVDDGVLTLIVGAPLADDERAEIESSLDVRVQQQLAVEPRVKQALARDYAHPLEPRAEKALARLEGRTPASSLPPNVELARGPSFSKWPRPPSIAPVGFPRVWSETETPTESALLAETAKAPAVVQNEVAQLSRQRKASSAPPLRAALEAAHSGEHAAAGSLRPRRRGPYTTVAAKEDLDQASDPEEMVRIYFDYAAQYFDYSAVLALRGSDGQVRASRGLQGPAARDEEMRLPLERHPCLADMSARNNWSVVSLFEVDPALAKALGCGSQRRSLLLPVRVRGKAALVVVGGFDDTDVSLNDVGELLAFEAHMSQALERAIRQRKSTQRGESEAVTATDEPTSRPREAG